MTLNSRWLCVLALWLLPWAAWAQADTTAAETATDTALVHIRVPDAAVLEALRTDPSYRYAEKAEVVEDDWLSRVLNWFWELFQELVGQGATGRGVVYLIWAIAIILVVFAISRLLRMETRGLFGKARPTKKLQFTEVVEDLATLDFPTLIHEALANHQFRTAVRYQYLYTLHLLTEAGHILWRPEKTNHHYLTELRTTPLHPAFSDLTYHFEYSWYGDFPIDAVVYQKAALAFEAFNQQINRQP